MEQRANEQTEKVPMEVTEPETPSRASFAPYIHNVLKQVHPDTTISHKALAIMDR